MTLERQKTWWEKRNPIVQAIGNLVHNTELINMVRKAENIEDQYPKFNDTIESIATVILVSSSPYMSQVDKDELGLSILTYCIEANIYEAPEHVEQIKKYFLRGIVASLLKIQDPVIATLEKEQAIDEITSILDFV